jgi:hypothetical protein
LLNSEQVKLLQTAVRAAGIRLPHDDGRYRLLLAQYRDKRRQPVLSCKDLSKAQLEDVLAICESHGWQHPGKEPDHYRRLAAGSDEWASYGQQQAIRLLFEDLGYPAECRANFLRKMTEKANASLLTPQEAYNVIEALKAMLSRIEGRKYHTIKDVQRDMEVSHGKEPAPF